jgi:protein-L-isoaspartate O-methyltransferase
MAIIDRRSFVAAMAATLTSEPLMYAQERQLPAGAEVRSAVPDVIYISTPHDVVARMLELARVRKKDVVYDLGCGDGRIVVAAAKTYGCRSVGIDFDEARVHESREKVRIARVESLVRIEHGDIFEMDLKPASVVTLYLTPRYNARLVPQLKKLKPGSRIVSHQFGIPGTRPDKVLQMESKEDHRKHAILLWTAPLG